jgi:hypothetical protein
VAEAETAVSGEPVAYHKAAKAKVAKQAPNQPYDWQMQMQQAANLDQWAAAVYQLLKHTGVFKDANHVKRGFSVMIGEWPPADTKLAFDAYNRYANAVADGAKLMDASAAAAAWYTNQAATLGDDDDPFTEGEFEEE